ncbi:hypothetical protein CQA53_11265, partial [Helicobacter didelphidarum]
MLPLRKCEDEDMEYTKNAFEVSISNEIPKYECKTYDTSYEIIGNLRISQSLNLKEKAPIDMVIFLDKKSAKIMHSTFWYLKSPYKDDIYNHKIVREILGEERFRRFMSKRFHYETISIEAQIDNIDRMELDNMANIFLYDFQIPFTWGDEIIGIANLSHFHIITTPIILANDNDIVCMKDNDLEWLIKDEKNSTQYNLKIPVIKGLFATTTTNENDFFVNLRDKPDSKDSKILMQ